MFKISDKVVRIKVDTTPKRIAHAALCNHVGETFVEGKVYVINKVITHPAWGVNVIGLTFAGGITCFCKNSGFEIGYDSRDFRKLEEIQAENKLKASQPNIK